MNQTNQLDLQTLLESNAKIRYAEEGTLTESDKLILSDLIGGYIGKKKQREQRKNKNNL
ncbi:hypothetical protein [Enterococcus olivae]